MFIGLALFRIGCFLDDFHSSRSYTLPSLLQSSLTSEGEEFDGVSPLRVKCFKVSHYAYCLAIGPYVCSNLLQGGASA